MGDEYEIHYDKATRVYSTKQSFAKYVAKNGFMSFKDYVLASVEQQLLPEALWWLPDSFQSVNIGLAIQQYIQLHRNLLGTYEGVFPPQPSDESMAKLVMPFQDFLEENEITALMPILRYGLQAQGYGVIETASTFYVMCWVTPSILNNYILRKAFPKAGKYRQSESLARLSVNIIL